MKQTRKRRILIVDDSEMNREILTGILEDEYDIVEAEDGKKAIAIMEEGLYSFSIVLLDITMPELDGFGVLQVMQQPARQKLPCAEPAMARTGTAWHPTSRNWPVKVNATSTSSCTTSSRANARFWK